MPSPKPVICLKGLLEKFSIFSISSYLTILEIWSNMDQGFLIKTQAKKFLQKSKKLCNYWFPVQIFLRHKCTKVWRTKNCARRTLLFTSCMWYQLYMRWVSMTVKVCDSSAIDWFYIHGSVFVSEDKNRQICQKIFFPQRTDLQTSCAEVGKSDKSVAYKCLNISKEGQKQQLM